MESLIQVKHVVSALIFSVIGIVILTVSFYIFDKLTPGELWHEIVKEKNLALAITAAATMLAMAQIIAAAMQG